MSDAPETVRVEREAGGVVVVTIDRPERDNALDRVTVEALLGAFAHLREQSETRVVILAGAGERAFSAGADWDQLSALAPEEARLFARRLAELAGLIEELGRPTIAAVGGAAYGAGCDLALACSLRVATNDARFGYPEPREAILAASRLARMVGRARAYQLLVEGEAIGIEAARTWGLIARTVGATDELLPASIALGREIGRRAPLALRYAMEALRASAGSSLEDGLRLESSLFGLCFASEDAREGARAFLEKREPDFRGR